MRGSLPFPLLVAFLENVDDLVLIVIAIDLTVSSSCGSRENGLFLDADIISLVIDMMIESDGVCS